MLDKEQNYIPVMTSAAGLCLTADNWQEVRIKTISVHLDALLLKPGYELLKKIPNLALYLGWSGNIVLNASNCVINKSGTFTLTSPYDGSKLKLNGEQLAELIQHIKPNVVLLPPKIMREYPQLWDTWDEAIFPFVAAEDRVNQELQRAHGVYFELDHLSFGDALADQLKRWSGLPLYVILKNTIASDLGELKKEEAVWIESDEPAAMAMHGMVLSQQAVLQLTEDVYAMQFDLIETSCACPTCSQQLTKAYLHHLYLHTPLLCQRFLIQHNVYCAWRATQGDLPRKKTHSG